MDRRQTRSSSGIKMKQGRNKKKKIELCFDEFDRQQYLTGVHGRKKQRKQRAKEQLDRDLKIELKRLKEKKKKEMSDRMEEMRQATAPTVDDDDEDNDGDGNGDGQSSTQDKSNTIKYELDEQTVEIKAIDLVAIPSIISSNIETVVVGGEKETKHKKIHKRHRKLR